MHRRSAIGAAAFMAVFAMAVTGAQAFDDQKYPDWKGQWLRTCCGQWDPTKRGGLAQQAPLTKEYQAELERAVADLAAGGPGNDPQY